MVLNCFKCKAEVVFDSEHIGKNGKKIPLDPATKTPHDCPMRNKEMKLGVDSIAERLEEKDDHGNEMFPKGTERVVEDIGKDFKEYVDHTLKGQSKVKIFYSQYERDLETDYNKFLAENKVKTQGAQFQMSQDGYAIALYYEEIK